MKQTVRQKYGYLVQPENPSNEDMVVLIEALRNDISNTRKKYHEYTEMADQEYKKILELSKKISELEKIIRKRMIDSTIKFRKDKKNNRCKDKETSELMQQFNDACEVWTNAYSKKPE